jgi:hypothetical protein
VSVLLAERADCKKAHDVARSYQGKGTLRTMATIVKHRGLLGLYTGLRLHLRESIIILSCRAGAWLTRG